MVTIFMTRFYIKELHVTHKMCLYVLYDSQNIMQSCPHTAQHVSPCNKDALRSLQRKNYIFNNI